MVQHLDFSGVECSLSQQPSSFAQTIDLPERHICLEKLNPVTATSRMVTNRAESIFLGAIMLKANVKVCNENQIKTMCQG